MKVSTRSQIRYRIIDFINAQSWLSAAVSVTLCGIALLWAIGALTLFSIQNTL